VAGDGKVYEHELGYQYSGSTPYARGGPIELGNGDRTMHVLGIVSDENAAGGASVSFRTRRYPNSAETVLGTTTLSDEGKADLRFSARQVEIVVTGATSGPWRWGDARLDVQMGGKR
jgi:hypothetical protein